MKRVKRREGDSEKVPERDLWLYNNPEALAMFQQGLAEAAAGQVVGGVDFTQYADDDIEDE
jgi:hypothetical protein